MKSSQFDAKTGNFFTAEIVGPSYAQRIEGPGYFIIINPDSPHVNFSKSKHDICMGDVVSDVIPDYTNEQYLKDYGDKIIETGQTVREFCRDNCRMAIAGHSYLNNQTPEKMKQSEIILEQLGGNKFISMTGARVVSTENGLFAKIKGSQVCNQVNVDYFPGGDCYRLTFLKIKGFKTTIVTSKHPVQVAELKQTIETVIGLRLSL